MAKKGERQKKSDVLVPGGERFDVGLYIDRTEVLEAAQLALDKPMTERTFGQVREWTSGMWGVLSAQPAGAA